MDPILFFCGIAFLILAFLAYFDRDRLWRFFQMERGYRERNPERTPQWDAQQKKWGVFYIVAGIIAVAASFIWGG